MAALRLFIALNISDAQREDVRLIVTNLQKGIRFTPAHPAWVAPGAMHLTLKFLGSVEDTRAGGITEAVQEACASLPAFPFDLRGLGVFPNAKNPTVLWLGMGTGNRECGALAKAVDSALEPLGFPPEKRAFHPHLTLARIKSLRGVGPMMQVVESHNQSRAARSIADHLTLYRSHLSPQGARYEALHRWQLAARAEEAAPRQAPDA